jgi:hypothetical protein
MKRRLRAKIGCSHAKLGLLKAAVLAGDGNGAVGWISKGPLSRKRGRKADVVTRRLLGA